MLNHIDTLRLFDDINYKNNKKSRVPRSTRGNFFMLTSYRQNNILFFTILITIYFNLFIVWLPW